VIARLPLLDKATIHSSMLYYLCYLYFNLRGSKTVLCINHTGAQPQAMAPAKAVIGSPNMEYSSQIGVMRQKAMDEKLEFDCILQYYRKRLLHLHTSCPDMPPHLQQYRAEHQTWSSFCKYTEKYLMGEMVFDRS
jgi:hypothetical protein